MTYPAEKIQEGFIPFSLISDRVQLSDICKKSNVPDIPDCEINDETFYEEVYELF